MKTYFEKNRQHNLSKCRSNSQFHYLDRTSNEYNHRIKLDPQGEKKMELRNQIPVNHIVNTFNKNNYKTSRDELNAYEKANLEEDIREFIKKQKYQKLIEADNHINDLCNNKNKELKAIEDEKKQKLKEEVTSIIRDSLIFSKKNNPIVSMLPDDIGEIVAKVKQEKEDVSLNLSSISKTTAGGESKPKKNEFLSLLGVDVDNLSLNNINVDIDKAWNFVSKWSKGRDIAEILRYKVVNAIMSLAEKKAAQKVKQINEKLVIYKQYLRHKNREERKEKEIQKRKKIEEMKKDPKTLIKQRVLNSVKNQKHNFSQSQKKLNKKQKYNLFFEEPKKKEIIKLDSYRDVDDILYFIGSSKNLNANIPAKNHFINIKETKKVDNDINKLKILNEIISK